MKKNIIFTSIIICLIILCMTPTVYSADSLPDPNGNYDMLDFVVYRHNFMASLADQSNIPQLISQLEGKEFYPFVVDGTIFFSGTADITDANGIYSEYGWIWLELEPYILKPQLLFGESVSVRSVYCFDGTFQDVLFGRSLLYATYDDIYVYYETDIGDYVLYVYVDRPEKLYLVPLPKMQDYAKTVSAIADDGWGMYHQSVTEEHLQIIEAYELSNPHYTPPSVSDFTTPDTAATDELPTKPPATYSATTEADDTASPLANLVLPLLLLLSLALGGFIVWLLRQKTE